MSIDYTMCWTYRKNNSNMVLTVVLIIIVFGVVIHSVSSIEAVSDVPNCHQSERQALLSFKHHLTDPSDRLSSWVAGAISCCGWHGVVCDNLTGHVLELHLRGPFSVDAYQEHIDEGDKISKLHWLGGKLDDSLLDLKYLHYLDLSNNDFGGIQVPLFFGSMHSLTYLNLSAAGFGGEIPSHLGNLSNLLSLSITGTGYGAGTGYGIITGTGYDIRSDNLGWLYGLPMLRFLDLSYVMLPNTSDGLQGISALPLLEELHLQRCWSEGISHFPNLVNVNFSNLVTLDLRNNSFDCFPGGLENKTSLKYLDLSFCFINSTFPNWLYKFSRIEKLILRANILQGTIAGDIANLTFLNHLDLSANSLEGEIPRSLSTMCKLEFIDLSWYRIRGNVSDVLRSLTGCASNRLHYISLSGCELHGSLSFEIGQFQNLEELDLYYNNISGTIPDSLGSLDSLLRLDLSSNKLNEALPEALGQLHRLEGLNLRYNSISGPIPDSVGSLKFLVLLDFSSNNLSGTVPESLGSLSSLIYLGLSRNKFSGNLPVRLGQLVQLRTLDVSFNFFEGLLSPVFFANLTSLRNLYASGNRIHVSPDWILPLNLEEVYISSWYLGPKFPKWLSSLENLWGLDISNAGITDSVPGWFWNKTSQMSYLNMSHNHLYGEIAGSSPHLYSQMVTLDLYNNSFSGHIPSLLCAGESKVNILEHLHLGDNNLFGEIPDCWSNQPYLESIELQNNNLTGSLPKSLRSLSNLRYLHLRNNSLSGVLPSSLQNCTELLIFDIADNKLRGTIPNWIGQRLLNLKILSLGTNYFSGYIPNEFCALSSLVILDMSHNNLSGPIPNCLANFSAMTEQSISDFSFKLVKEICDFSFKYVMASFRCALSYEQGATLVTKALVLEYLQNLRFMTAIDLSNNSLSGPIPESITNLIALRSLNLSRNSLTGKIPRNMGNMSALESLDLSFNRLSGEIPQSMASMTFLEFLNMSFNDLVGRIPTSTQIQGFDASSFIGNRLCGPPVSTNCGPGGSAPGNQLEDNQHDGLEHDELYASFSLGYIVGLGAVIAPLLYSTAWRHHYFRWAHSVWDRLWVWTVLLFRT